MSDRHGARGVEMMMPPAVLAGLILVGVGQAPTADTIAVQLDSQDARTVVWGVYNAGVFHRQDLIPRLQHILETSTSQPGAFTDVVLDALIQLNARIPAQVIVPYIDERPVQSFVLMSTATDREGVLLDLLPRISGYQWFAAANLLLEDGSPGLAEHLAHNIRLQLTVDVSDDDSILGLGGGGGGGGVGCGVGQALPGYPPHAEYRFESAPRPGFAVLAAGPRAVYYSRTVSWTFQYPVSHLMIIGPTDEERVSYLRAMLLFEGNVPLLPRSVTVPWTTTEAFAERVRQLQLEVLESFRRLVDAVRQVRPIPQGVPDPPVNVRVIDRRADKTIPLPNIGQ